ncbi:MAG: hypothetical protein ABI051_11045 [Vicinamibacterales bacterium]
MVSTMRRVFMTCLLFASVSAQTANLGVFANAGDVGAPALAGSTVFDPATKQYRIAGAGINMWAKQDQFQYVWKEMTGDFSVAATLQFVGQGAEHRKGGIMVRQSLDTDATYADVMIHGNGMPSLQWRPRKGEDTNTFDLPIEGAGTFSIRFVRTGVKMFMYAGRNGAQPKELVHTEVAFQGPVLVGLAVCSHDPAVKDTVVFSNVSLEAAAPAGPVRPPAGPAK